MVTRQEKLSMAYFVIGRIEDSKRYIVNGYNEDRVLIQQDKRHFENPVKIHVVLHNRKMTIPEYRHIAGDNYSKGIKTANIFYKDGEMFMVRLAQRGHFKGDDRSLKRYSKEQRDNMIHLRGLEKQVLEQQNIAALIYFQPETPRTPMSLRGYGMRAVELDYSHIGPDDPGYGFVKDRESIDYKLAEERFSLASGEGGIRFPSAGGYRLLVLAVPLGLENI